MNLQEHFEIREVLDKAARELQIIVGGKLSINWKPEKYSDNIEQLKEIICNVTGVSWEKITGTSREMDIKTARQLFAYFGYKVMRIGTLKKIGEIMGDKDHTTVIHSIRIVNDLMDSNDEMMCLMFFEIEKQIKLYAHAQSKTKAEAPALATAGQ